MNVMNDSMKNNINNNQMMNVNNTGDMINQYNMNNNMMLVNQLNQMKISQPYMIQNNFSDVNNFSMYNNGTDAYLNKINYVNWYMIRSPKRAILLFSVHPLINQSLLHLI